MRYGKVNEAIWTDDKFSRMTTESKLFFIYLMSCSKCNSVGIFQTGLGVIEDEFGEDRQVIRQCISELEDIGLVHYDNGWMWFGKFLKWNQPTSPNHARQCAAVLNDIVSKNAPAEAVCNFLGSAHPILSGLKQKTQSGTSRSYWEDFRSVLSQAVVDYVGGEDSFRDCLQGKACAVRSTVKALSQTCGSTVPASTDEVLPKHWTSTSEALGNKDKTRQVQDNNKTRQDKTKLVESCKNNAEDQVTLICSDGQPYGVSPAAVLQEKATHPLWDWEVINARFQSLTALNPFIRPKAEEIDRFFHESLRYFDGDRINLPQNQFSAQNGDSISPQENNASVGVLRAYAEG